MVDERAPRDMDSRETEKREALQHIPSWTPPNILPDPAPSPGWVFRWVRTAVHSQPDPANVSQRFREGWVPVKAADHPEIQFVRDHKSSYKDGIEIGGLLLCKMPEETWKQRDAYYRRLAESQMQSVDQNFMRENHPSMPLLKPERQTRVTFGRPKG